MFRNAFKNFFKKHFYYLKLREQLSPAVQISQLRQFHYYQQCLKNGNLPKFNDSGFKVFSQFEEDGKLLYIFSIIGMGNKTFVDLGSHDGINSNCANLVFHFNWHGLFIDADKTLLERGKSFYAKHPNPWNYQPKFRQAFITKENVNTLITKNGISGEIELLAIDIDGNDYWIWEAISVISPKVVLVESQVAFGFEDHISPYSSKINQDLSATNYGASTSSLVKLGNEKGYRLVGSNEYGNNLFFVKNGIGEEHLPEISFESTLTHPWATEQFATDNN